MNTREPEKNVLQNGAEPAAGRSTVPIWQIIVFALLFYWSSLFVAENAGGFSKDVYNPYHGRAKWNGPNPVRTRAV